MKPLDGIVVLDFGRVLAAPSATQALAELGATVIKVERPGTGDETRGFEPRVGEESAYFFAFNRGKRSITLDLKSERGRDIAKRLASTADVVVENFLPGVMDRLGLGYGELSARHQDLVYVSTTGFGQAGPLSDQRGYDTVFQAMSGIMSMTGEPDGPPSKSGVPISDLTSGMWTAIAVLTGLVGRSTSGRGCYVDVAMLDVQISLLALSAARVFALDEDPHRTGTDHPGRVPSRAFRTVDDSWVQLSVGDQHWRLLCEALALDDLLADPELSRNAARVEQRHRVIGALVTAIGSLTRDDVIDRLQSRGVPVGVVRSVREALAHENTAARAMIQSFDHPEVGSFPGLRTPLRFVGWDDPDVMPPPQLGEGTDDVLRALGLSEDEIEDLHSGGVA